MTNLKLFARIAGQFLCSSFVGLLTVYTYAQLAANRNKISTGEIQSMAQQREKIHGNTQTESPEERADCTVYQTHNCSI